MLYPKTELDATPKSCMKQRFSVGYTVNHDAFFMLYTTKLHRVAPALIWNASVMYGGRFEAESSKTGQLFMRNESVNAYGGVKRKNHKFSTVYLPLE